MTVFSRKGHSIVDIRVGLLIAVTAARLGRFCKVNDQQRTAEARTFPAGIARLRLIGISGCGE
jgi:hypothetical protein